MKTVQANKLLALGIVCAAAVLLVTFGGGSFSLASVIPYIAFCACAYIVRSVAQKAAAADILKILLVGIVLLPVFDFLYLSLTVSLLRGAIAATVLILLQAFVFFGAFVLVCRWTSKTPVEGTVWMWVLIGCVVVLYAVLAGISTASLQNAIHAAMMQETDSAAMYWLAAMDRNILLDLAANVMYYGALFLFSAKLAPQKA